MTDNTRNTGHGDTDPRELTGAYALDAVSPEEAAAFEQAAESSEALRDEVDGLQETAALLGLASAPVTPSERMKLDLMAKIASTPQLPAVAPAATSAARPDGAADAVAPAAAAAPTAPIADVAPAAPAPSPVAADGSTPAAPITGRAEARARTRWLTRPTGILVAAVAAVALFIGGGVVGSVLTNVTAPTAVDASAAALADILAADDAQRASAPIETGGTATLVWSNSLGRSAVLVDGLPELPEGKVYEAWYIDPSGPASAGTFTPADAGTTWHVLDGTMSAGDAVGVTVEPAGGSEQPTTTPIVVMQSA